MIQDLTIEELSVNTRITDEDYVKIIIDVICNTFNVSKSEMLKNKKSRKRTYVNPRFLIFYFIDRYNNYFYNQKKRLYKHPLQSIGKIYDKDHASVIHAIKVIKNDMFTYREYEKKIDKLDVILHQKIIENQKDLSQVPIKKFLSLLKLDMVAKSTGININILEKASIGEQELTFEQEIHVRQIFQNNNTK